MGNMLAARIYDPPTEPLQVIHRDDDILVVNKPDGLLSVPGKAPEHADCLETRVKQQFDRALLVHRLDMDTSGIMIFAMNRAAQRHLGLQFEKRQVDKRYVALVWGKVVEESGQVDLPMIVDWPNRPLQKICHDTGKSAVTDWQVIGRADHKTRLHLMPKTGRSHQLRVHMKEMGYPIVGDRFYASGAALAASPRLLLHSERLAVFHPVGGKRAVFTAPCPF